MVPRRKTALLVAAGLLLVAAAAWAQREFRVLRGFEQANHARLNQIINLHTGRHAHHHVVSNTFDQRCIILNTNLISVLLRFIVHG